jgi:hypothetical protein
MGRRLVMGIVIVISGRARVGKDTLGGYLREIFRNDCNLNFGSVAYAGVLKEMVQRDFGLTYEQLWGNEKEKMTEYFKRGFGLSSNPEDYWTPREIMQEYGAFYRSIDPNFWVRKLFSTIPENAIITDGRYPNEILPVLEMGGCHVRVYRDFPDKIHGGDHESETSLDGVDVRIDYVVHNDGTFEDLKREAKAIVDDVVSKQKKLGG